MPQRLLNRDFPAVMQGGLTLPGHSGRTRRNKRGRSPFERIYQNRGAGDTCGRPSMCGPGIRSTCPHAYPVGRTAIHPKLVRNAHRIA